MANQNRDDSRMIFAPGTQVVALGAIQDGSGRVLHPPGAVGVVVKSPCDTTRPYRVRFPDGVEETLGRDQMQILKRFKAGELAESHQPDEENLFDRVILRCVVGSRAYGLEDENSDTDYRGIYLPSADRHWSLYGVPEQLENEETQEAYWELQKFLILALKANPNVLECLYTPMVEHSTPLADELLAMRASFLSRLVYQTFNGYVMSQFKKMQADLRNQGRVKWKHVMHLVRLLICGTHILREGIVPVRVIEHRETLLSIKRGELPWEETERLRRTLHQDLDAAFRDTTLPERPDYAAADRFLRKARRASL